MCAQLKSDSNELYNFCLQFVPDLVLLYLTAVYQDLTQVCEHYTHQDLTQVYEQYTHHDLRPHYLLYFAVEG